MVISLVSPVAAHAQSAEAEVLFSEGRKLIKQGKLVPGCDKLAASEELEPSVGTLLNLGDCREKLGKLASAWASFKKAEALAKRDGRDGQRQAEAARRAAAIQPNLATLVIEVQQPVAGLVVKRDTDPVATAAWNTAVPVDPDHYVIVAEAPGYKSWRTEVFVDGKLKRRVVTVPRLEAAPAPAAPTPVVTISPEAPRELVRITRRDDTWTAPRKFAAVLAVAGVGGLGAGVYFGSRATDLRDQANERCPLTVCADARGLELNDDAQTAARRANIAYIAGGAAVAVATVIWFVGAPGEHTVLVPAVGNGHTGVSLSGRF
ncbi:MAG: hypothetical protein ABI867_18080 [Kofleriaceae bacterium]